MTAAPDPAIEHEEPPDKRRWAAELVGAQAGGRFRLERLIEVGGMGAVFEAAPIEGGEPVAIKVLVPGLLQTAHTAERLRREALRAGAVDHGGVVRVHEFVMDDAIGPFLVMELLRGESLSERLARTPRLPNAEAVGVALDVLDILEAVHACSILHRDLKPGNLFFARSEDGGEALKLLDFGLARSLVATEEEATLTVPGTVVGTPRYMAPEQARARGRIDHRVDLYSVGALLYRMLSGHTPYADWSSREVILAVRAGPCAPLSQVASEVPKAIAAVVDRAMCTDPEDRYESARSMKEALRAALVARPSLRPDVDDETVEERVTLTEDASVATSVPSASRGKWGLGALGLAAVVAAVAWWSLGANGSTEAEAVGAEGAAEAEAVGAEGAAEGAAEAEAEGAAEAEAEAEVQVAAQVTREVRASGRRGRSRPAAHPSSGAEAEGRSGRMSRDQF